jgi:hypothetical protein
VEARKRRDFARAANLEMRLGCCGLWLSPGVGEEEAAVKRMGGAGVRWGHDYMARAPGARGGLCAKPPWLKVRSFPERCQKAAEEGRKGEESEGKN